LYRLFTIIFIIFATSIDAQSQISSTEIDKIIEYRELSANENLSLEERLNYAKKSVQLSKKTGQDSTILLSNRKLSFVHLLMDNYKPFRDINHNNLRLATKLADTVALAYSYNNLGYYHHQNFKTDSAYFYYSKAVKLFNSLKLKIDQYQTLRNIADIQETEKDYVGGEENAIKAIKIINTLPNNEDHLDNLWTLNNLIGIISLKLKSYDKAIEYHNKALSFSNDMRYGYYNRLYSTNNLAEAYKTKGDIDKSIELYKQVVDKKSDYFEDDPSFYAISP